VPNGMFQIANSLRGNMLLWYKNVRMESAPLALILHSIHVGREVVDGRNVGKPGTQQPSTSKMEDIMAKKRKSSYKIPKKTCWHLYSLQTLNNEKFVKVVNKILRHEWQVIK
jgi:hypothetical protein